MFPAWYRPRYSPATPFELLTKLAARESMTVDELRRDDRRQEIVDARARVATSLRMSGLSYIRIGRLLHRDHSTVINLVRRGW